MGLYLGIVFLVAAALILALKALSDSIDSCGRYEMLRRIGAPEKAITGSLFRQQTVLFLIPLILAAVHSVFGIQTAMSILETVGMGSMLSSVLATALLIIAVYGGYFLITVVSSRKIIRG